MRTDQIPFKGFAKNNLSPLFLPPLKRKKAPPKGSAFKQVYLDKLGLFYRSRISLVQGEGAQHTNVCEHLRR